MEESTPKEDWPAASQGTRRGAKCEPHISQDVSRSDNGKEEPLGLAEILNAPQIQSLMESFTELTGIGNAILDTEGNVIESTGWSDICGRFHRANERSRQVCKESDLRLVENLKPGEIRGYKCGNNLWDFVAPIYIGDAHVGNIYTGQFFFEDESVDERQFIEQADRFGFDRDEYLAALGRVPRFSRDDINSALDFLSGLATLISELSHSNVRLREMFDVQKRTEERLRGAEERYRGLYEGVPSGLYRTDASGYFLEANRALLNMLGYDDTESMRAVSIIDMYADPEARDEWLRKMEREGMVHDFPLELTRRDGTVIWVQDTSRAGRDENGDVTHYEGSLIDITRRTRVEEELAERDVRVNKIAASVTGMVYQFQKRPDGTYFIPFTNDAIKDIFDCTPEEVKEDASAVFNKILPEDLDRVIDTIEESGRNLTPWQCEYRVQLPGQAVRWMWGQATPERLPDGGIIWHGFNTDISALKNVQDDLRGSEERYRRLVQDAPDVIYRIRYQPDARLDFINPACETIFGYTPEEILEKPDIIVENTHPDDRHIIIGELELSEGAPESGAETIRMIHKNGNIIWCDVRFIRIFDSDGKLVESEGILRDISDRVTADQELRRRQGLAEAASLRAQIYLDFIAHDLTNILSPMMTYADMILADPESKPRTRASATKIMDQIGRASSFVKNTRRLSASDRMSIDDMEHVDLGMVFESVESDIREAHPSTRFEFSHGFPTEGPMIAKAKEYVTQMIEEVLDNSWKHGDGDDREIDISVSHVEGVPEHGFWRVEIADHGPGIPDKMKTGMVAEAFDPENRFRRGIASTLSFMALIAEHIGGRMSIEDRVPGDHAKGAKIVLLLPRADAG